MRKTEEMEEAAEYMLRGSWMLVCSIRSRPENGEQRERVKRGRESMSKRDSGRERDGCKKRERESKREKERCTEEDAKWFDRR